MRVLLDTCVWGGARGALESAGHEVEWIGDGPDPGDAEILDRAVAGRRVLVTLDKDFGEIAVVNNVRHSGIIRLVSVRAADQGPMTLAVLDKYAQDLQDGAIVTVEPARVRIRRFED